ncbi:hypothetical protein SAMN05444004_104210 [Jannaschia faecimaris]|uniref:Uncharacterized protein n=1 Tax=Jannaschia faecimaris TaxID=1244108 RepID=A0A1H3P378_9RHOB|nr:hypothetical protein [Jannaschia faecimaris]SDY95255.1 hypothetical protein SAMN05444004_104210 [Jannaschia faecimaris]
MTRKIKNAVTRIENAPLTDILGGVWLVTLMLSLMHLPSLIV